MSRPFEDATKDDYLRDNKRLDDVQRYAEEDRDDAAERAEEERERWAHEGGSTAHDF